MPFLYHPFLFLSCFLAHCLYFYYRCLADAVFMSMIFNKHNILVCMQLNFFFHFLVTKIQLVLSQWLWASSFVNSLQIAGEKHEKQSRKKKFERFSFNFRYCIPISIAFGEENALLYFLCQFLYDIVMHVSSSFNRIPVFTLKPHTLQVICIKETMMAVTATTAATKTEEWKLDVYNKFFDIIWSK